MVSTILFVGILLFFAIILFYIAYQYFLLFQKKRKKHPQPTSQQAKKVPCPICNSTLYGSETIFTTLYKSNNKNEQVCIIHGCPHCYPIPETGVKRTCPVCHKQLSKKDHLDAYLFNHINKKNHLHITGCNKCGLKSQ